ncbi:hypothetical protein CBOM_07563 [Ceraceosorus bombacis]|uniref:Uncharacterized protein n=1 Tax=Ceraceosorus bombacis TaxID=401625 RepID=A0A0P1BFW0_9BASI|nr:hypothetical protein CBOM_07563 [Ceraceosorus bombacis]
MMSHGRATATMRHSSDSRFRLERQARCGQHSSCAWNSDLRLWGARSAQAGADESIQPANAIHTIYGSSARFASAVKVPRQVVRLRMHRHGERAPSSMID